MSQAFQSTDKHRGPDFWAKELTLLLLLITLMMTAPEGATLVLYDVGGPVPLELFTVTGVCSSALTPEPSSSGIYLSESQYWGAAVLEF